MTIIDAILAAIETEARCRTRYKGHVARRDEVLAAEVVRLNSRIAELEAVRAWRPIETAPIDGTQILIAVGAKYQTEKASWSIDHAAWMYPSTRTDLWFAVDPSHWMPLPAPPETKP